MDIHICVAKKTYIHKNMRQMNAKHIEQRSNNNGYEN